MTYTHMRMHVKVCKAASQGVSYGHNGTDVPGQKVV